MSLPQGRKRLRDWLCFFLVPKSLPHRRPSKSFQQVDTTVIPILLTTVLQIHHWYYWFIERTGRQETCKAGVSNSFSSGATSASWLPSKGPM